MKRARALAAAAAVATATGLAGCAIGLLYPAPAPIASQTHFDDLAHPTRCLIVFLPGFKDDETAFTKHGFLDALRERHMAVDSVSTDLTIAYYPRHEVVERIQEDVLRPLAYRHYKQIWLVGVSMGGFGAVVLAEALGAHVAGMFLLSPFLGDLGDHGLLEEIDHAGGLRAWDARPVENEDDQRRAWRYLKWAALHPEGPPVVFLGHGDNDVLGYGLRLLGDALPPDHVFVTPGNHDWSPWTTLWVRFLDESNFKERCAR
jgi:pimeloyl-ACP methyl ester carboxylesterase